MLCLGVDVYFAAGAAQIRPHGRYKMGEGASEQDEPGNGLEEGDRRGFLLCTMYYRAQAGGIMRREIIA